MEPYSASSGWEKVPVSSASQRSSDQTDLLHQDCEPRSVIASKAVHGKLIRALTELRECAGISPFLIASQAMLDLIVAIEKARDSSAPVLITGETGTGKELISLSVHAFSTRRAREFIPFNCADASRELIESELFGHRRGSFTGATSDSKGIIREADGGTLLLDEIGELPLDVQPKLLRFLQEGEVRPVGAPRPIKTDARVIAATNRNLEEEIRAGRFRADLFERLNVLRIHIPPLRERRDEIPLFIAHFLDRYQQEMHKQGLRLSDEAAALLLIYHWPRNVRQLANEIYRLVVWAENGEVIGPEHLSPEIRAGICASPPAGPIVEGGTTINFNLPYSEAFDEFQRQYFTNLLKKTKGNLKQAAMKAKVDRGTLREKIKRLGIKVKGYGRHKSR